MLNIHGQRNARIYTDCLYVTPSPPLPEKEYGEMELMQVEGTHVKERIEDGGMCRN
jgi:hypothetical protein